MTALELGAVAGLQGSILDALPAHVALVDSAGTILAVNAAWRRFGADNGARRDFEPVGASYLAACDGATGAGADEARLAAAGLRDVLAGARDAYALEYALDLPAARRWFRMTVTPVPSIGGAVVMHLDITEQRRVEESLRASEAYARAIFEHEPECVKLVSVDGGLLDMNPAGLRLIEADNLEAVRGTAIATLVHPDDRHAYERHHRAVIAGTVAHLQFRIVGLRGTERWMETHSTPLRRPDGTVGSVLSVTRDISERKQAEARLLEQAALLDQAHDAIIAWDPSRGIRYWSRGAAQRYGWAAAEALGRPLAALVARDPAAMDAATRAVLDDGEWTGEVEHVTRDRQPVTMLCRWTGVRDAAGRLTSIVSIHTDITERKQLEQQLLRVQRLDSLGRLAGGIAHDLNNVLAPIVMIVGMLRRTETSVRRLDDLAVVESCAQRGADMVRQLLSFARGDGGRRAPVEIAGVLAELRRIVTETFPRDIALEITVAPGLWPVSADATQLHQLLVNLCVNARDAMPHGGALTITAERAGVDDAFAARHVDATPGPHVRIAIEDTGTGMPPEVLDRIFEPFFTTKEVGKGTGLGLSAVHAIVRSHRGFVHVRSAVGAGTRFEVYLPAATGT